MKGKKLLALASILTCTMGGVLASCTGNGNSSITPVDEDLVAKTKLKLDDDIFKSVMTQKTAKTYDESAMDFNRDGVERVLTKKAYAPYTENDAFTNYVDGDTTQFTSYNGLYTIKVRYLAVDTPESTSEIEEWGKSASLFNQSKLKNATYIIVQSAESAKTGKRAPAEIDGYQRSLAYVWYTNVEKDIGEITKDDFRNLNLELVYEGYSGFNAPSDDMDTDFYNAFANAYDLAQSLKKHKFSSEKDPNYCYDAPEVLGLNQIYDKNYYEYHRDKITSELEGYYSTYCDDFTWYSFDGYVTRVVGGTSFYIQNEINGKYYGLYVFTLRSYAPVKVGNWLRVTGVLSYYSGIYELKGVNYGFFNHGEKDIKYIKDDGTTTESASEGKKQTVEPIKVTAQDIANQTYPSCLVELDGDTTVTGVDSDHDGLIFQSSSNSYGSTTYGGSQEVNTYNDTYPFYNTDNSMVLFGRYGKNTSITGIGNGDDSVIRVKINSNAMISGDYETEYYTSGVEGTTEATLTDTAVCSYKFFCGGTHYYVPGTMTEQVNGMDMKKSNARYAKALSDSSSATIPDGLTVYKNTYTQKIAKKVIGMSVGYVSSGGNSKPSIEIVSSNDFGEFGDATSL